MIQFIDVKKVYQKGAKPAVNGISLTFNEGEITVLVGPSGCGKTTTLKMINRIEDPTSGQILVAGRSIMDIDPLELRRDIGYVIQHVGLFPHVTIEENVATVPHLKQWPKEKIAKRVEEMLELVNIPASFRKRLPGELSGGQQQRVGVARALAGDPPIMLMDEPFGALDPITREHLQQEFLKIQKRVKKTIVFVTHDIEEAFKMGDRIVVMRQGNVMQFDTPLHILGSPADDFVSDLTGSDRGIRYLNLVTVEKLLDNERIEKQPDISEEDVPRHVSVKPQDTLKEVLNCMIEHGTSVVPVVDDQGQRQELLTAYEIMQGVRSLKKLK